MTEPKRIQKPKRNESERVTAAKKTLVAFLEAWRDKRWVDMAACATFTWRGKRKQPQEELAHRYGVLLPTSWDEPKVTLHTLVICRAVVMGQMAVLGEDKGVQIRVQLVCERGAYDPHDTGKWLVAIDSISPWANHTKAGVKP